MPSFMTVEEVETVEAFNRVNIVRLEQLKRDAHGKYCDWTATANRQRAEGMPNALAKSNAAYYAGMHDAFKRAIDVLNGKG